MMKVRPSLVNSTFIINPEKDLLPDYKISPFSANDIAMNKDLPSLINVDNYFRERFKHERYSFTINGRSALNLALRSYNLKENDCVTIYTTSGNLYISSCVTKEIEKFCSWSRKIERSTKLLLVNHEFGYPYEGLEVLEDYGLPIIEDCAHSFFSWGLDDRTGRIGDYVIYSFPKMFPIQIGGLLVSNVERKWNSIVKQNRIGTSEAKYIKKVIFFYLSNPKKIIKKRRRNYKILRELFGPLGVTERFPLQRGIVPGVFLFNIPIKTQLLPTLKEFMYQHGIQCSVFYGEKAFYIPVHQNLEYEDLDYFKNVIKAFIERGTNKYS